MSDEPDKLPPADYSHIFKNTQDHTDGRQSKDNPPLSKRIGAMIGGLLFCLIPLVFFCFGLAATVIDIWQHYSFAHVQGTVVSVVGKEPQADRAIVTYKYAYGGSEWNFTDEANVDDSDFEKLQAVEVGRKYPLLVNPTDPRKAQVATGPQTVTLSFTMFSLIFLTVGVGLFRKGLSPRATPIPARAGRMHLPKRPSPSLMEQSPVGWMGSVFMALCLLATIANAVIGALLPWPANLVGSIVCIGGVIGGMLLTRRIAAGIRDHRASFEASIAAMPAQQRRQEEIRASAGSLGKKMAIVGGIALFWCGMTSVFVVMVVRSILLHHAAKSRFLATQGTVLSGRVKTSTGSDGSTHKPVIKYEYTVDGKVYASTRYDYTSGSRSGNWASDVVRRYPAGTRVTVYYDPDDPADAILSLQTPTFSYFMLLFMQPFVLAALCLIAALIVTPIRHARLMRFLAGPFNVPWPVPTWGVLRSDYRGLTLQPSTSLFRPIYGFMGGYGLACFASIFIIGFLLEGFNEPNIKHIAAAFLLAAAAGALATVLTMLHRPHKAVLTINTAERTLSLQSPKRNPCLQFDNIANWNVREVTCGPAMVVNGRRIPCLLLEVLTGDSESTPIHVFAPSLTNMKLLPIAHRTMQQLAELTDSQAQPHLADPHSRQKTTPAKGKEVEKLNRRNYADLM